MLTGLKSTLSFCLLNQGLLEDWMVLLPQLEFLSFRGLTCRANGQSTACLDMSRLLTSSIHMWKWSPLRDLEFDLISFRWRRKFLDLFGVFVHYGHVIPNGHGRSAAAARWLHGLLHAGTLEAPTAAPEAENWGWHHLETRNAIVWIKYIYIFIYMDLESLGM